ncbi:MAG: 3-phosphoshikimate 1-carboxyvinyltransferase [Actinomycetaceae bacterium]|nr:3-phosphoshikimate 1-carboxyvinyltransferase [Actinomycetaceae bacterium]
MSDSAQRFPDPWPAPLHPEPLTTAVRVPGSKSLTNRYLVLAALGDQPSVIREPLVARDTVLMARALESMGTGLEFYDHELFVYPGPLHGAQVTAGLAGTVMRFLPAVAALAQGDVLITGDEQARRRPMDPIVRALTALGVNISHATREDGQATLPLTVHGTGYVTGGRLDIDASASSQFISALLLAAPRMDGGLELRHTGTSIPSTPHLEMTVEVLRDAGIEVFTFPDDAGPVRQGHPATRWIVRPGVPDLGNVEVEPDLSNAGPFLAAAMVTGGTVQIPGWPRSTRQPGEALRDIFARMGGETNVAGGRLVLQGPRAEELLPLDMDMHDVGELVPTVAAVAALSPGRSVLRNIGQLRGHETDRLHAITTELNRLGGRVHVEGDDLVIEPTILHGGEVETYADHRMATFAAILGLRVPGITVRNIATTSKTLPQFPHMWMRMVADEVRVEAGVPDSILNQEFDTSETVAPPDGRDEVTQP